VATFLYTEIAVVIILLLPFISPTRWNSIFQSNAIKTFKSTSHYYFRFSVGILFLLFVDAIRSVRHYTAPLEADKGHEGPLAEMQYHMKLFRGQRNLYICGFALFLVFVIRRLVVLLAEQANLIAQKEAALKQAKSASDAAQSLMAAAESKPRESGGGDDADEEAVKLRDRVNQVGAERDEALNKVESLENQLNALKRQAEGTNREYDRLMAEHEKLQRKLGEAGAGDSRKDD